MLCNRLFCHHTFRCKCASAVWGIRDGVYCLTLCCRHGIDLFNFANRNKESSGTRMPATFGFHSVSGLFFIIRNDEGGEIFGSPSLGTDFSWLLVVVLLSPSPSLPIFLSLPLLLLNRVSFRTCCSRFVRVLFMRASPLSRTCSILAILHARMGLKR